MGRPKTLVELGGRALIEYPLAAAAEAGLETAVVAKASTPLPSVDAAVIVEPDEPQHPLNGLIAALNASEGRPVIALGCDMPFVDPALLEHLAGLRDALAVCKVRGRLQPLLGRYEPSLLPHLATPLEDDWALTEAVTALHPRVLSEADMAQFGDPAILTFNVNDDADLAAAEALLKEARR